MADPAAPGGGGSRLDPRTAAEMAKAMQDVQRSVAQTTQYFEAQLRIVQELRDTMQEMCNVCDKQEAAKKTLSDKEWKKVADATKNSTNAAKQNLTAMQKLGNFLKGGFAPAAGAAVGAISGLWQGLKNLTATTKAVTGFFGGIVKGAFNVGKSILAIPFKMMSGLFNMANQGGGDNSLAQAIEDVRKEFGDLKKGSSASILSAAKDMKGFNETGLSTFRVFGNATERLKAVHALASALGPQLAGMRKEFEENAGTLLAYQKGLGLSEESMADLAARSTATGQDMKKTLLNIHKQADGMAKAFGLDAKVISREMGKAAKDVAHFGHMSEKQLGVAVAYANRLGVSIDKLTGLMDQFDTFDSAAENVSALNEQFGTNIDAQKIMEAQTPQEKMELLRQEFAKTGKDLTKLSYQERKLIAQRTGLDAATLDAAMSQKNANVSLNEMNKVADKAEDKTLSQADAMKELAKSIERLTPSGGGGASSIFGRIVEGFTAGIKSSPEFIKLMGNLRQVLMQAYMFGVKLGKMFVDLFPGVKQIFGGLANMFSPARFQKMFDGVLKAFDVFKAGGSGKMEDFMANIQKVFTDFFDSGKPAGKKVLEGFKTFGKAILAIFGKIAEWVIPKIADIIISITEWLKKPKIPDASGAAKGLGGALMGPLDGAFKALQEKLVPALKDLAITLFTKLKDALLGTTIGKGIIAGALGIVLGPALIQGLAGAGAGAMFKKAGQALLGGLGKGTEAAGEGGGGGILSGAISKVASSGDKAAEVGGSMLDNPAAMVASVIPDKETIEKLVAAAGAKINWAKLTGFLLGMAGVFAVGLGAFTVALQIVKGQKKADLIAAAIVVGALIPILQSMGGLVESFANIGNVDFKSMMTAVLAMAGLMLVGLGAFWLAIQIVKDVKVADLAKAAGALLVTTGIMYLMGPLVIEAASVGGIVKSQAANLIVGMLSMAGAVVAIAGVAMIISKMLGGIPLSQLTKSILVTTMLIPAFAASGLIVVEASAIGAEIIATGGAGAAALVVGMIAMAAALVAIAGTALLLIKMLGGVDLGALAKTTLTLTAISAAFAASALIVAEASAIGAAVIASAGAGAVAIVIGMVAMAAALIAMAKTALKLIEIITPVDIGAAVKTGVVMTAIMALFALAGGIVFEAAAIGMKVLATVGIGGAAILIGMVTMKKSLLYMADTANEIINKLGTVDAGKALTAGGILTAMGLAFAAAGVVVIEAGLIGAMIIGSLGAGSVAITKGMKVLGEVVGALTGSVTEILKQLDQIQGDPKALGDKADAFTTVLDGVSKMTDSVAEVLGTIDWDDIAEQKDAPQIIDKIGEFVQQLLTGKDGSGGITKMITTLVAELSKLGPEQVEIAKAFGPLLGAVGNLIQSMTGPALEMQKASTHWYQSGAADTKEAKAKMDNITGFVSTMGGAIGELVKSIAGSLNSLQGNDKEMIKVAGEALGGILGAIGQLVSSVAESIKDSNAVEIEEKDGKKIIKSTPNLTEVIDQMKDPMVRLVDAMKEAIQRMPADDDFKKKVEATKGMFAMMAMIPDMAKKLAEASQGAKEGAGAKFDEWAMTTMIANIATFFNRIFIWPWAGGPPPMLAMAQSFDSPAVKKLGRLKAGIEATKLLFELLSTIPKALGELSKAAGTSTFDAAAEWAMTLQVVAIGTFLQRIALWPWAGGPPPLQRIADAFDAPSVRYLGKAKSQMNGLKEALAIIPEIAKNASTKELEGFDEWKSSVALSNVATFLARLANPAWPWTPFDKPIMGVISENLQFAAKYLPGIKATGNALKSSGLAPTIKAVADMAKALQEVDDALAKKGSGIDVKAKLAALASGAGLGAKGFYTVNSKEVVINVAFTVTMETGTMEKIIVTQKNSVIRDRINFLLNNSTMEKSENKSIATSGVIEPDSNVTPRVPIQ